MKEKKKETGRDLNLHPNFLHLKKVRLLNTRPYHHCTNRIVKLIVLSIFLCHSPFKVFEPCGGVFMMNATINLRKNSSKEYFKAFLHYFRVLFTLGFYTGRSMNAIIFFFVALAEVQVAVLSVLNLPRQGFLAPSRFGHCCVCSPLLFASEILCDSPTYSKQNMNKTRRSQEKGSAAVSCHGNRTKTVCRTVEH